MRENPIRAALAEGRVMVGTWINIVRNPAILTLLRASGLDYARVDMEHSSPSIETIAGMAALARALEFPIVVRPPEGSREWITRLLDSGVWNLHIPQVDTPEQAAAIVRAARYAPDGARGMSNFGPHTDFETGGDPLEGTEFANRQVHLTIMLESREAFTHLDEIAAMPGVDALTLGPSDLAQDLGVYGSPEQSRILDEHRYRMIEAARKHGKDCALRVDTPEEARRWMAAGVRLLVYSSDMAVLRSGYRAALEQIRRS